MVLEVRERKARAYLGQILLKKEGLHGLSDGGCIVATEQSPQKWLKCNPVSCVFEELRCSPGLAHAASCPSPGCCYYGNWGGLLAFAVLTTKPGLDWGMSQGATSLKDHHPLCSFPAVLQDHHAAHEEARAGSSQHLPGASRVLNLALEGAPAPVMALEGAPTPVTSSFCRLW